MVHLLSYFSYALRDIILANFEYAVQSIIQISSLETSQSIPYSCVSAYVQIPPHRHEHGFDWRLSLDIVWDEYIPDSLKSMTRHKRGKGTRRRVQPNIQMPGNWQAFLRINENKMELFKFLAEQSVSFQCQDKQVISTSGKQVLLNFNRDDVSQLFPCTTKRSTQGYYSLQQILQ